MELKNIVKGLLIASINAYLKGSGATTIVFSADEIAKTAGYEDAKSEEARETINKALRALLSISILYEDDEEYSTTAIATATFLKDDKCVIDMVEGVVSLFKFIEA